MYSQNLGSLKSVLDAVAQIAPAVARGYSTIANKKPSSGVPYPEMELPEITVTPRRINPWLIAGGAAAVGLLLYASRR